MEKTQKCKDCKYAVPVDAKHQKYYCIAPDRRSGIHDEDFQCEKG